MFIVAGNPPVLGRFMQEDVYQGDGLNLYAYCHNNPVMYYDPSGYDSGNAGEFEDGLGTDDANTPRALESDKVPESLLQGEANTSVYLGMIDGEADYVGITYDVPTRQAQHGDRFTRLREITQEQLTRRQAREIEQVMIENNPSFSNKINSISSKRDWYKDTIKWATQWLKDHGFFEFLK